MKGRGEAQVLGNCVTMILINNRMYKAGRISEDMKTRISGEIMAEYQRMRSN